MCRYVGFLCVMALGALLLLPGTPVLNIIGLVLILVGGIGFGKTVS